VENVAHTVAGLLVAEVVVEVRRRRGEVSPSFARIAAITSAVANNVPDADVLYDGITQGKLGYLLHHRGHTHTLFLGIVLGLAVAGVIVALARGRLTATERSSVLALGGAGPVLHLFMDGWNVYGVHPFWPLDGRWVYGDAVFIVEPLIWAVAIPPLVLVSRWLVWRVVLCVVLAAGLALPWLVPAFVPLGARIAIVVVAAVSGAIAYKLRPPLRAPVGLAALGGVAALFLGAGVAARAELEARLPANVHDIATSALPANPGCWTATTVETTPEGELIVRRASVALLVDVAGCPTLSESTTAPLEPVPLASDARVRWDGQFRAPIARLRELAGHCEVAALLRFVRVPFFVDRGDAVVVGDLRFDRDPDLDFAEVEVPRQPGACPEHVPPWTPPRADLLGP
jgi:inner membrane protein